MANEHSIRVSARGEFGQLENGLKNLQRDLKSVLGEIDKGARRGGLFDDTQLRALDVYRNRFKSTMSEVDREMQKQNDTIDQLHRRRQNSSKAEQDAIDAEIRRREKALDILRRQIRAVEDLSNKRNKEAAGYGTTPSAGGAPSVGGSSAGAGAGVFGGAMSKVLGLGKFMAGLAGITGIASMAMQSYNLAYQSQTMPLNLSQRIRGYGYQGSAKGMWDTMGNIGRNDSMGYTSQESWNFQDMYSRQAGSLGPQGLEHALMFGRAYGLEVGETAGGLGTNRSLGGTGSSQEFANMIAASVGQSGMTPRILEVLQTSNGLLEQMNTSLKDGGSRSILAYQTILDKIGNDKGMMKLTGQQGANIISGLGGIFNPGQDNQWKWMGIQALQQYNPKKYGKMGLYGLESSFEAGLENPDNVAAMSSYIRKASGGDTNTMKRMMQRWLQDGGYNATKGQVNDLYSATNGFTAFDSDKVKSMMGNLSKGDGTAKYQERMGQLGQDILDTNSRFEKQLENLGQPILLAVQGIKEGVTSILEAMDTDALANIDKTLEGIKKFMDDHLKDLATIAAVAALAPAIAKLIPKGGGRGRGGKGGKGAGGGTKIMPFFGGANLLKAFAIPAAILGIPYLIGKWLQGDGAKKFFDTWFPKKPRSKEEQKAFMKGADPENKHMNWYEYANPTKWKDIDFGKVGEFFDKIFGFTGSTEPAKEFAKKNGYKDPSEAYESLKKLGDSGLVNITGLTDYGKQKLEELAKQGLIKLTEGKDQQTTTIKGFTEAGKKELKLMADSGAISLSGFKEDGTAKITVMSKEAKEKLEDLRKKGLIDISKFENEGTSHITSLSKEGAKKLIELQKNGSLALDGMNQTTDTKLEKMRKNTDSHLGDIEAEHKEIKDKTVGKDGFFSKMFDKIKELAKDVKDWFDGLNPKNWFGQGDVGKSPFGVVGGGKPVDPSVKAYSGKLATAGKKYGIDDTGLLMAIMNQESHGKGNNPMQVNGVHDVNTSIDKGVAYFAKVLKKAKGDVPLALQAYNMGEGYIDYVNRHGGKHSAKLAKSFSDYQKKKYGYNIYGDPDYVNHVLQYYNGGSYAASGSPGGSIFKNWDSHINSWFGDTRGRSVAHNGLDLRAKQGTRVNALTKGKIAFINMDDGGKYDKDGRKNTRSAGSEIGVRMSNGEIYYFAHMSKVNQDILKAFKSGKSVSVGAGTWLGNSGGTPGVAGSGYSTSGAHLHMGYMGKNGYLKDPQQLLRNLDGLGIGQGDMGIMPGGVVSGSTVKDVNVTVTLKGETEQLNHKTKHQLEKIIKAVIKDYESQKLLLNPSI